MKAERKKAKMKSKRARESRRKAKMKAEMAKES
jgi:hypothetical protein